MHSDVTGESSTCSHRAVTLALAFRLCSWPRHETRALTAPSLRLCRSAQEIPFPSLSPTMTQGNLIKWYKKEGDEVAPGDVLADVETDKATMAFENQEDGFIAKLLVPEGASDIQVGHPVAILVEDAADVPKFASYVAGQAAPSASPAAPAPEAPPAAASAPAPDVAFKVNTTLTTP